jgi:hypothetical protein
LAQQRPESAGWGYLCVNLSRQSKSNSIRVTKKRTGTLKIVKLFKQKPAPVDYDAIDMTTGNVKLSPIRLLQTSYRDCVECPHLHPKKRWSSLNTTRKINLGSQLLPHIIIQAAKTSSLFTSQYVANTFCPFLCIWSFCGVKINGTEATSSKRH